MEIKHDSREAVDLLSRSPLLADNWKMNELRRQAATVLLRDLEQIVNGNEYFSGTYYAGGKRLAFNFGNALEFGIVRRGGIVITVTEDTGTFIF